MYFSFSESAKKDLRKLPEAERQRIKKKLVFWQATLAPLTFAKALTQHEAATHRFRIGAWRVLVRTTGQEMRVLRVRNRKDVYNR